MTRPAAPEARRGHEDEPAVALDRVTVRLGDRIALSDVSLEVAPGAFVGLLGPNGSGKTTLLRTILGIVPTSSGCVRVEGLDPSERREVFSYLPQRRQVEGDVPLRAWDVVMMGRIRQSGWMRGPRPEDRDAVGWALEKVGMADRAGSSIGQLSFGQQQRVFFARALAQEGRLLLLDEPMNGVDSKTQDLFVDLLNGFHVEGRTIVMATHDLNMAACICDTLCILNTNLVAYGPPTETFRPEVLRAAYGAHLHFIEIPQAEGHPEVLEDVHHHDGNGRSDGGARLA